MATVPLPLIPLSHHEEKAKVPAAKPVSVRITDTLADSTRAAGTRVS